MENSLLKEARDLLWMCSFIDKSGQCEKLAEKIDEYFKNKD